MKHLLYVGLILGLSAAVLPATTGATLSFGEITLATPHTTPPTYVINVVMAGTNTTAAGVQFDVNYDPTQMNVTIGLGAAATAASKELSTICLGSQFTGCTGVAQFNPSTTAAMNNGPGQRAIIIGAGLQDTSVSSTAGPSVMADGVVATLTVTTSVALSASTLLTLMNPAATTAGALNTAAVTIPIAVGAGSNGTSTGTLDLYHTYLVGDVTTSPVGAYPPANEQSPGFGKGSIKLADVLLLLQVSTSAPGFATPPTCSDYFDAMKTSPLDTASVRGGFAGAPTVTTIKLADVLDALQYSTNAPGFQAWPVRTSLGSCAAPTSMTANAAAPARPVENHGSLVFGQAEGVGTPQERVPVYLEAGRDLARVGLGVSFGDQQSQLQFLPSGAAPSLMETSQRGVITAAWLEGLTVRAGGRVLLGYVVGPAGSAANLRVFGVSAMGLSDQAEVGLGSTALVLAALLLECDSRRKR